MGTVQPGKIRMPQEGIVNMGESSPMEDSKEDWSDTLTQQIPFKYKLKDFCCKTNQSLLAQRGC